MRLAKLAIISILGLCLGMAAAPGVALAKPAANPVDCYALLVVAANDTNFTRNKNLDPVDINGAEVAMCRVYATLIDSGYKDSNIRILYWDGKLQPDWTEKKKAKYFKRLKKNHFKKGAKAASVQNIQAAVLAFKKKIDSNDQFVFYIICHGAANGTLLTGLHTKFSSRMIEQTFSGFKSKTNYILFDSCYSGKIIDIVDLPNAVILTATSNRTPGWVDRNFSSCAYFMECKCNLKFDENKDGFVDCQEAYNEARRYAKEYDPKWREYIKTKYRPPKPTPPSLIRSTSLVPVIEIGNEFEKKPLGPGTGTEATKIKKPPKNKPRRDRGEKLMKRAKSFEKKKKFTKAIDYYKKVEKMGKRTAFSTEAAARIKELLSDKKIAAEYERKTKNKKIDANLRMAESYFLSGCYDKVEKFCRKVIAAAPKNSKQSKKAKRLLRQAKSSK